MRENTVFEEISKNSSQELFSPIPKGYKPGKTKFVVITGSVMSGIGKGTTTSGLCKLFADRGINVEPIKLEAYLNVDAGTLNPFRHGEVFVLADGTETDMDLGSYERFTDKNLSKENFVTSGSVYQHVINKERKGLYLGRDVQFIPHVTGEIKSILRNLALNKKAEIVIIEIGGTVGDYENMFALEALREMQFEEGKDNVCFLNVTYVVEPPSIGEQKSKAAQLGIKRLIALGIQPDILIVRSHNKISEKIREKLGLSVSVPLSHIFGLEDSKSIYEIPLILREKKVDERVLEKLKLNKKFTIKDGNKKLKKWVKEMSSNGKAKKVRVGIAGKYTGVDDAYISILKALEHASAKLNVKVEVEWIDTGNLKNGNGQLKGIDALIVPGGFGTRGVEGKIKIVELARKKKIPFLGLCYGFQMALIEIARNELKLKDAHTTEVNEKTKHPVVCLMPEQYYVEKLGGSMRLGEKKVELIKGTNAYKMHEKQKFIGRRFRHRYECNSEYIKDFEKAGIVFSGKAPGENIMQILELKEHPFFMASQYHPEFTSRPLKPDPLFYGLIKAALKKK